MLERKPTSEIRSAPLAPPGWEVLPFPLLDAVLAASGDLIFVIDREGRFLYVNPAGAAALEQKRDQVIGRTWLEMGTPLPVYRQLRTLRETVLQTGEAVTGQTTFPNSEGERLYTYHMSPDRTEEGGQTQETIAPVSAVVLTLRDVTEQNRRDIRANALLEAMPQLVWLAQPDGSPDYFNQQWSEYTGVSSEETIVRGFNAFVHPDDVSDAMAAGQTAARTEERYEVELRLRRHDDTYQWFLSRGLPMKAGNGGLLCWVGTCTNIDAQKRLRLENERLLEATQSLNKRLQVAITETHHRVKNNLQVISAMLDMQTMDGAEMLPADEFRRLSRHISTLAILHDILTQQVKAGAGLAGYVSAHSLLEKLLPMLEMNISPRRLLPDLMEVQLSARQGTSLALVTNELISNALKHGKGDVRVRFTVQGNMVTLTVEDDGPGFPPDFDPERAANTGLELIKGLTRTDLKGTIQYGNLPGGGACICISFSLTEN